MLCVQSVHAIVLQINKLLLHKESEEGQIMLKKASFFGRSLNVRANMERSCILKTCLNVAKLDC